MQLAIDQSVAFVLIAGDLYDGDWKDHRTGLYFVSQMVRLREAGIPVIAIAGNHDAANKMTRTLPLPENVRMLDHKKPETFLLEQCGRGHPWPEFRHGRPCWKTFRPHTHRRWGEC